MPETVSPSPPSPPATPRPSATVILVRDGREGVEVFLMERSNVGMFGGLHVFPGGKVDGADHAERWEEFANGLDDTRASEALGMDRGGLAYWVACIRECFEEAGVLLASRDDGELLPLTDPDRRVRFTDWRTRLNARELGVFEAMCESERLGLATDRIAYVGHWITPVIEPKRFSTRFFVAQAPDRQEALHDGFETVESAWMRPELALERFAKGELNLISPTFKHLESIVGYDSAEALLAAKHAIDPATIPTIQPRLITNDTSKMDEILDVVGRGGQLFDTT